MDKEIFNRWVLNLRLGTFPRTDGVLREDDGSGYCCLGVLCAIQNPNFYIGMIELALSVVPKDYSAGLSEVKQSALANMNDNDFTFQEIADFLEQNIDKTDDEFSKLADDAVTRSLCYRRRQATVMKAIEFA